MISVYKTKRSKAWRNTLVYIINQALQLKVFSLYPSNKYEYSFNHSLSLTMPGGLKADCYISAVADKQISLSVTVFDGKRRVHIVGWLVLAPNKYLIRYAPTHLKVRMKSVQIINALASIAVQPLGYVEHGELIL